MSHIFLIDGFGVGGTELNAVRTLEAFSRRNLRVTIVHFQSDGPLFDRAADSGHAMVHVPVVPLWSPRILPRLAALASAFRSARAEVIHSQDVYSNILGVAAARLIGIPILTSRRWKDDVPRRGLTPLNAWAHRHSTLVLPNSGTLAPTLREEGVPGNRIFVHENFIDDSALVRLPSTEVGFWRQRLGIDADALVAGCVARMSRVKRHDVLINAWATVAGVLPSARLVLVGDGEMRATYETRVRELGLEESVIFTGVLPNAPLPQQMFDVAVLTSQNEGFPNALVEASACGVPLVATMVGGVADVLRVGDTGLDVPVGDSDATARAILRLLLDRALRERLGTAGRELVIHRFSEAAAIQRLDDLYRNPRRKIT